jgi:hypothetical protein
MARGVAQVVEYMPLGSIPSTSYSHTQKKILSLDRHFSKDIQTANKHMKRLLNSTGTRGNANQTHSEASLHIH